MNKLVEAELHAHAQQLMRFCREQELGFVLVLLDTSGNCERVTNLDDAELHHVGSVLQSEPEEVSHHRAEEPS